jgi:predicted 2-oxoglutarate/Fe(II)-dependent dioxygenase YbiX/peroxiredoxin
MFKYKSLVPGEPAPWFRQHCTSGADFCFDTIGGRYIVLCFFGSAGQAHAQAAVAAVLGQQQWFDDVHASFFGVSNDPADRQTGRVTEKLPGYRCFWDFDGRIARQYGILPAEGDRTSQVPYHPKWMVIDPTLRIMKIFPFERDQSDIGKVLDYVRSLPPPHKFAGFEVQAPVLLLPNVFEAEFCHQLIQLYDNHGGEESGFVRDVGGKTVTLFDANHKRRKDYLIKDDTIIEKTKRIIARKIAPEIAKVHQFHVTRMERYIVSCYAAEDGGHFRSHRDNTTRGTQHRRFAVSINLNDGFEGGEVFFPEYGPRGFKMPAGGAVVFSCSLLHAVTKVTSGRRYAFLPFLYDDAAAKTRAQNNKYLGEGIKAYTAATGEPGQQLN